MNGPLPLLLTVSLCAALSVNILRKLYTARSGGNTASTFAFSAVSSATCALVLLLWGGFGTASGFTVMLGIIFGIVTSVQNVAFLAALRTGPMSYTSIFTSLSTIISALSGMMFWNENLEWSHVVGIALMLVSFVLAVDKRADKNGFSWRWLLLCIVCFFTTGAIGVMQKAHQSSLYRAELGAFLIVAFAVSFLTSCTIACVLAAKSGSRVKFSTKPERIFLLITVLIMLASGVGVAVNNKLNLFLSGVMESAVFFPVVNGGGLVLSTLAALVIFKERLSARRWVGVSVGIVAVVLLCNPFR